MIYSQRRQNCLATAIAVALRRLVPDESVFTPDAFHAEDELEKPMGIYVRAATESLAQKFGLGDITFDLDSGLTDTLRKVFIQKHLKQGYPTLLAVGDGGDRRPLRTIVVNDLKPDGSCEVVDPNVGSIRKGLRQVFSEEKIVYSGHWYRRR